MDGTPFPAEVTLNAVKLEGEETLFALISDITDEKEAEKQAVVAREKLAFRAAHDSLTGLLNREQLHNYVEGIIENYAGATDSDAPK